MNRRTISAHYELYALRDGRWVMDACFADEDEARAAGERVRRAHDVRGIRLVRELCLADDQEPIVTVVFDSTHNDGPLVFKEVAPKPQSKPTPAKPVVAHYVPPPHARLHLEDDEPRPRAPHAMTLSGPWLAYAFGAAGFAAAIGVGLTTLF
ncbi:MAG: hypothetical protein ACOC3D_12815 [Pseudomonadota bacterium]